MDKKEIEALRHAAESSDANAMFNLSIAYGKGEGVEKDPEQAIRWTEKAAEAGHTGAMFNLSIAYKEGEGVEKNLEQAIRWTEKAAEAGHTGAMFNLSVSYRKGEGVEKNLEQAIRWTKKAAKAGHTGAMFNLSIAYRKGEGVEKNLEQAIRWAKKAAEAGHTGAMFNLSVAYMKGEGVEKDLEQAIRWVKKAAKAGHTGAMFNLSVVYMKGEGVEKDLEQAIRWVKKAAEAGDAGAMFNLSVAYMKGEGVEKDLEQAIRWTKNVAESGDTDAMFNLSIAYKEGEGVEKDLEQAIRWAKEAAEAGHTGAMFNLSIAYREGEGVEKDLEQAIHWAKKAAEASHTGAMFNLSVAYMKGEGVKKDLEQEIYWTKKAAEAGHANAMFYLSIHYLMEHGLKRDLQQAVHWIKTAASKDHERSIAPEMLIAFWEENNTFHDDIICKFLIRIMLISNLINKVLDDVHLENELKIVYHYTDMTSLQSMLDGKGKNFLRLYNPMHFNDPEEGNIFIESEDFIRYFYVEEDEVGEGNVSKGNYSHLVSSEGRNCSFYICSFSGKGDRLDLWRAYGHHGKGYSVSVKVPSRLRFKSDKGHMIMTAMKSRSFEHNDDALHESSGNAQRIENILLRKVVYGKKNVQHAIGLDGNSEYQQNSLGMHLKDLKDRLEELSDEYNNLKQIVKRIIRYMLGDLRYLYKNDEYESENEYRVVCVVDSSEFDKIKIDKNKNPPRLYVETAPFLFEEEGNQIIIGPNIYNKDAVAVYLDYMIAINGWKNKTAVNLSRVPYRR